MRFYPLPAEIREQIQALYRETDAKRRIIPRKDKRLDTLNALDAFPGYGLVQYLVFLLFEENTKVASRAADMLQRRLAHLKDQELCALDRQLRRPQDYLNDRLWHCGPGKLRQLQRFDDPTLFFCIATFFPNGHTREKAVYELAAYDIEQSFRYLLLRLNDWVPQVRAAAKQVLLAKLAPTHAAQLLQHTSMLQRLDVWGRDEHADTIDNIETVIAHPDATHALRDAITHSDFRVRRYSVKIAVIRQALPPLELYELILHDPDPIVKCLFLQHAAPHLDDRQLVEVTHAWSQDGFVKVRKATQELAIARGLSNAVALSEQGLFDLSRAMRESSRWHLKQQGKDKAYFLERYRTHRRHHPASPAIGAILGLGDVGTAEDAQALHSLLIHPHSTLRRAAFQALTQLAPNSLKDWIVENITHESNAMIRQITRFISDNVHEYDMTVLWALFEESENTVFQRSMISITAQLPKWQRLIYLLRAAEVHPTTMTPFTLRGIGAWLHAFNHSFTQPTASEIQEFATRLDKSGLETETLAQLRHILNNNSGANETR